MTTIKIVNKGCDGFPLGSYHKIFGETDIAFKTKGKSGRKNGVLKDWCEVAEMPFLTAVCTSCTNLFSPDHEFKDGECIRCWKRHNNVNR